MILVSRIGHGNSEHMAPPPFVSVTLNGAYDSTVPMQMHVPKEQIRLNEMEADTELNSLVDNVVEDSHAKTRKVGGRQS